AERPPMSCIPKQFTGGLLATEGGVRAYEVCRPAHTDGSSVVDPAVVLFERPGPSPLTPSQLREQWRVRMTPTLHQAFPRFSTGGPSCPDPTAPYRNDDSTACVRIGIDTEHPGLPELFKSVAMLLSP